MQLLALQLGSCRFIYAYNSRCKGVNGVDDQQYSLAPVDWLDGCGHDGHARLLSSTPIGQRGRRSEALGRRQGLSGKQRRASSARWQPRPLLRPPFLTDALRSTAVPLHRLSSYKSAHPAQHSKGRVYSTPGNGGRGEQVLRPLVRPGKHQPRSRPVLTSTASPWKG